MEGVGCCCAVLDSVCWLLGCVAGDDGVVCRGVGDGGAVVVLCGVMLGCSLLLCCLSMVWSAPLMSSVVVSMRDCTICTGSPHLPGAILQAILGGNGGAALTCVKIWLYGSCLVLGWYCGVCWPMVGGGPGGAACGIVVVCGGAVDVVSGVDSSVVDGFGWCVVSGVVVSDVC